MKHMLTALALTAACLATVGCTTWQRSPLSPYSPDFGEKLAATKRVLARHFTITGVDKPHGKVYAQSVVGANIHTKYRTLVEATVYPVGQRDYDVQVRVRNELEVSQPSLLGGNQPPHDWRTVAFDHVLEAALMAEVQAEIAGEQAEVEPRATYTMFPVPRPPRVRHRDFFRPPIPDLRKKAPEAKPEAKTPAPASPDAPPRAQARREGAYDEYMAQGDQYAAQGDDAASLKKALLEYQRAAMACPDRAEAYLSLTRAWTALGQYAQAAASLRQAARAGDAARLAAGDLRRLRELDGDLSARLMLLKGWCRQNPNDHDARLLLSYHCLLADRAEEARRTLQDVLEARPQDPAAQFLVRQIEARRS
ncbi:MAG: tetratricopeptide repeat protein [Candidatus Brocadiia bacterium]